MIKLVGMAALAVLAVASVSAPVLAVEKKGVQVAAVAGKQWQTGGGNKTKTCISYVYKDQYFYIGGRGVVTQDSICKNQNVLRGVLSANKTVLTVFGDNKSQTPSSFILDDQGEAKRL